MSTMIVNNENKTLKKEVQDARAGAALELEGESNKLRKERNDMLEDLESKLRTSEREANVREDALRHEVSELRKRWLLNNNEEEVRSLFLHAEENVADIMNFINDDSNFDGPEDEERVTVNNR